MTAKRKPAKKKPVVTVLGWNCEQFYSYPMTCFLCGARIPKNTWHRCSSAKDA